MRRLFLSVLLSLITLAYKTQTGKMALSIDEAEKLFLTNNLALLAEQFNISASEALVIQARTYPNPLFSADFNVYDPQNDKFLHVDKTGQKSFQVQQLVLLGGKRSTDIEIAKQNKLVAESEFAELLQELRLQLHSSFYNINEQRIVIENFDKQLNTLDTMIEAYKLQVSNGNIPVKDIVRLKSVYIKLNNTKSELAMANSAEQKQIKLLLQVNQDVLPIVAEENYTRLTEIKPLSELQDLAFSQRPDLKKANEGTLIAGLMIKRAKSQVVPDLALNGSYDQRGGAFVNQINAGVSLPIPVFNTNRGNIKAAEFTKQAMDLYFQNKKLQVEMDVQEAWSNMQRSIGEYNKIKNLFNEQFSQVIKGVNDNFLQRNISMLEYVDFVEAYNESLAEYERVKTQLAISASRINFATASKIY